MLTTTVLSGAIAASSLVAAPGGDDGTIIITPPISAPINGCGEVVADETCGSLFRLDSGPTFTFPGLEEFPIGDRFFISGDVCLICLVTPCSSPYAAILDLTVLACDGPASEEVPFEGCVEVVKGPPCGPLVQSENGDLYYVGALVPDELIGGRFLVTGAISATLMVACPSDPVPQSFPFFTSLTLSGCTGDLNVDGAVDGEDLALLLGAWGSSCLVQDPCLADLNGDQTVDGADLAILLSAWG